MWVKSMELKTTLKICFIVVIETIFCFTPLGTIPLGPIAATLSMVPVIIAALTFGKKVGMLVGGVFGLYSFIYWTFIMPAFPTAFLFTPFSEAAMYKGNVGSLVICFVPRILAGLTPVLVSEMFSLSSNNENSIQADVLASITNILAVLGMTVLTNGIPEAIICAIVCPIVVRVLRSI